MKIIEAYFYTIIAIIALPFITLARIFYFSFDSIKQLIWTILFSFLSGTCAVIMLASIVGGEIFLFVMATWCYISFGTFAIYNYKYILRRYFNAN